MTPAEAIVWGTVIIVFGPVVLWGVMVAVVALLSK